MNFWPECKTRVSVTISSFGSKAKMSRFSPNIFSTFYWFSGSLPCTVQHIKNLEGRFSVSVRYDPFWLGIWWKLKNSDFYYRRLIICFYWIIVFHLIKKYKLLIFESIIIWFSADTISITSLQQFTVELLLKATYRAIFI